MYSQNAERLFSATVGSVTNHSGTPKIPCGRCQPLTSPALMLSPRCFPRQPLPIATVEICGDGQLSSAIGRLLGVNPGADHQKASWPSVFEAMAILRPFPRAQHCEIIWLHQRFSGNVWPQKSGVFRRVWEVRPSHQTWEFFRRAAAGEFADMQLAVGRGYWP